MRNTTYVAVIGAAGATDQEEAWAEEVGRQLARAGAVLVCGGLGGVMHAAARGSHSAGGLSVGIVPGDDRSPGSPYLTICISTGMGEARNSLIVRTVDAVIAIGGEFGTLSEIGLALKMGKPVVGLATWELARHGSPVEALIRSVTPQDAVSRALQAASSFRET